MSNTVQYKKYILDHKGSEVLNTDFAFPVSVAGEHLEQIARDLANFTGTESVQADYRSRLEVSAGEDVIFVERDYQQGNVKLTSQKQQDPNFFWLPDAIAENAVDDRNPFVIAKFSLEQMLKQIAWALPYAQDLPAVEVKKRSAEEIEAELNQLKGDQNGEMQEVQSQIAEIENQLNAQRQADQAQISIGDLEGKINEVVETLKGVDDLVESQRDVHAKLKEYSQLLGADVMDRAEKFKVEVEKLRVDKVKLESELLTQSEKPIEVGDAQKGKPKFSMFLLVLPVILAVISVVGFVLTSNLYILALGIVGGILEALLFLAVNAVEPDIDVSLAPKAVKQAAVKINPALELDAERVKQIEQFFVNKAWLVVLKEEFASLQLAINSRLEGQNLGEIQKTKNELQVELDKLQSIIFDHAGKDIAPEEYLKLRRKLDMLKVEKAKLEESAAEESAENQIAALEKELELARQPQEQADQSGIPGTFIANANQRYGGVKSEDNKLWFWDQQSRSWVGEGLDEQSISAVFAYLTYSVWLSKKTLPIVLVELENWLPALVKQQIDARIEEWKSFGQVVVINAQK